MKYELLSLYRWSQEGVYLWNGRIKRLLLLVTCYCVISMFVCVCFVLAVGLIPAAEKRRKVEGF